MLIEAGLIGLTLLGSVLYDKYTDYREKYNKKNLPKTSAHLPLDLGKDNAVKKHDRYFQAGVVSVVLTMLNPVYLPLVLLNTGLIVYTTSPVIKEGIQKLIIHKRITHSLLLSIFFFIVFIAGQTLPLVWGVVMYHAGKKLLARAQEESKEILIGAFEMESTTVWLVKDNVEIEIPVEDVNVNDILAVNTGELIPVDGTIVEGYATIDEYALTGESKLAEKGEGESVFTSTVLLSGRICIKVEKTGRATKIAKIGEILDATVEFKTDLQMEGEKRADAISMPILGIAGLSWLYIGDVSSVSVLNSAYGNALRLLGSSNTMNYLNSAYYRGVLIKDGRVFEELRKVDTVLFDKTGTLTEEYLTVGKIIPCVEMNEDEVLTCAAIAEYKLSHPIAKAILKEAENSGLALPEIENFEYIIGQGATVKLDSRVIRVGSVRFMDALGIIIPDKINLEMAKVYNEGFSLVLVAINQEVIGAIELCHALRPEVESVIAGLREHGIKHISIVSGDHYEPTKYISEHLCMDSFFADVFPEDKAKIIERLQEEGRTVCFIGDGVNDSIAMKQANVSISLSGATTVARDIAQVVLLDRGLSNLCMLFDLGFDLNRSLRNLTGIVTIPAIINIGGIFILHFGLITTTLINNIAWGAGFLYVYRSFKKVDEKKEITA